MTLKTPPIKYTNKDFESIKVDLINYAKAYYPNTYKDFNEASFGSLLVDMVAYVGDMLSFYVDYQANEAFLDSAVETTNLLRLAKQMGFHYPGSPSSSGKCAFYALVAAKSNGTPNSDFVPVLKKGTILSSDSGGIFLLNQDVIFSKSDTQVVVAEVDDNSQPTKYAYKAYGEIISGVLETEYITVGDYEKFMKIKLEGGNISEITSVIDSEGHEYFQVDYLSQNIIYETVENSDEDDKSSASYILREKVAARRFIVEHTLEGDTYLQFGFGSEASINDDEFPDPSAAALNKHAKSYYTDDTFDPNVSLKTEKFGVVPPAGTMVVIYRKNTTTNVNASVSSVNSVSSPLLSFSSTSITFTDIEEIRSSIEVENEEPILGDVKPITPEEIRTRAIDAYASQNRAVTKQDYLSLVYRMPAAFGAIKRTNIVQDRDSFKRNLNLFVVSEAVDGNLTTTPSTVKKNLKKWLSRSKMVNDTIDILDGKISNIGIEFEIIAVLDKNPTEILSKAIEKLKEKYAEKLFFGRPFYISEIYKTLNDLPEILDTKIVKVVNKFGVNYSSFTYNVEENITSNGRYVKVPEDVVLEIKFPDIDIIGVVL